jgi:hypothetical protein
MMQVAETETFPAVLVWDSFASSQTSLRASPPRSSMTFHSPAKISSNQRGAVFQRISWLSTDCHLYSANIIASAKSLFSSFTHSIPLSYTSREQIYSSHVRVSELEMQSEERAIS